VYTRTLIRLLAATVLCAQCLGAAQGSAGSPQPERPHTIPAPDARVDINHASADELMKVPGMTRTWAGRIVRFRPYRSKQDLLDHGIVTSEVYDRIKDYVIAHRDIAEFE
jgi:DNA uptake protein ComE-like DNA-binding protein